MPSRGIVFVSVALVAAYLGYGGAAAISLDIADLWLGLFLLLLAAGIGVGGIRRASRGQVP